MKAQVTEKPHPQRNGNAGFPPTDYVELETENLVPYLVQRGLLSPQQLLSNNVLLEDITRNNRNFRVKTGDASGLLVKQTKRVRDRSFRRALKREAEILRFIHTDESMVAFRPYAPKYVFYDPVQSILITELINPATSLIKLNLYYGKVQFSREAASVCGQLLGRYHQAGAEALERESLTFLANSPPNGLTMPQAEFLQSMGLVGMRVWDIIKDAPFVKNLPAARKAWSESTGIIHGDSRWANFLVGEGEGPEGTLNIRLIDWEMASLGDSVWDAACFLGDYVRFMIEIAMAKRFTRPEAFIAKPPYAPSRHHASARAFWKAYCATRGFDGEQQASALTRIIDYLPYYFAMMGYEASEGEAAQGRDLQDMKVARLAFFFANEAYTRREDFVREWIGIVDG